MLAVAGVLRPGRREGRYQTSKHISYESGVDPVGSGWSQSQVRDYIFAVLFVMFDVEAVFIFPWATRVEHLGVQSLTSMIVFIVVLTLGLVYAWRKGVLRWA
jgi:NADH-quinone oxidoreductase subunit A